MRIEERKKTGIARKHRPWAPDRLRKSDVNGNLRNQKGIVRKQGERKKKYRKFRNREKKKKNTCNILAMCLNTGGLIDCECGLVKCPWLGQDPRYTWHPTHCPSPLNAFPFTSFDIEKKKNNLPLESCNKCDIILTFKFTLS